MPTAKVEDLGDLDGKWGISSCAGHDIEATTHTKSGGPSSHDLVLAAESLETYTKWLQILRLLSTSSAKLIDPKLITLGQKVAAGGSGQVYWAQFCGAPVAAKALFSSLTDPGDMDEVLHGIDPCAADTPTPQYCPVSGTSAGSHSHGHHYGTRALVAG